MPSVTATEEDVTKIRHGRAVNLPEMSRSRWVKVFGIVAVVLVLAFAILHLTGHGLRGH